MMNKDVISTTLTKLETELERLKTEKQKRIRTKTCCSFSIGNENKTNIHAVRDISNLLEIADWFVLKQTTRKKSAKLLGVPYVDPIVNGSPVSDWLDDIALIHAKITRDQRIVEIESTLSTLNSVVPQDLKDQKVFNSVLLKMRDLGLS